jgi:hypothetical protein
MLQKKQQLIKDNTQEIKVYAREKTTMKDYNTFFGKNKN